MSPLGMVAIASVAVTALIIARTPRRQTIANRALSDSADTEKERRKEREDYNPYKSINYKLF